MAELTFKDFIFEVFDTSHKILDVKKIRGVTFYYFAIQKQNFRVFVEEGDPKEYHVGFERFDKVKQGYVTAGINNDLNAKEVLGIFGTILNILKTLKPELVLVVSEEPRKHRLYINMMMRLKKELNLDVLEHDDVSTVIRTLKNEGISEFVMEKRNNAQAKQVYTD